MSCTIRDQGMSGRLYTIRILGLADGQRDRDFEGQYVVSYDPERHWADGTYDGGDLRVTRNRSEATLFDIATATALWRSGPTCKCHRLRTDGKPNRPLTAFTVEMDSDPIEKGESDAKAATALSRID
jgi:hypothetical protein